MYLNSVVDMYKSGVPHSWHNGTYDKFKVSIASAMVDYQLVTYQVQPHKKNRVCQFQWICINQECSTVGTMAHVTSLKLAKQCNGWLLVSYVLGAATSKKSSELVLKGFEQRATSNSLHEHSHMLRIIVIYVLTSVHTELINQDNNRFV